MDAFDDEPTPGGGYGRVIERRIFDPDGIPRRILGRFAVVGGRLIRVSIVLEERRDRQLGQVMRFDDAHGRFHRHAPGWPEPGDIEEYFDFVEPRRRIAFARSVLVVHYTEYDAAVFGEEVR
jgi:hypothetical protein